MLLLLNLLIIASFSLPLFFFAPLFSTFFSSTHNFCSYVCYPYSFYAIFTPVTFSYFLFTLTLYLLLIHLFFLLFFFLLLNRL